MTSSFVMKLLESKVSFHPPASGPHGGPLGRNPNPVKHITLGAKHSLGFHSHSRRGLLLERPVDRRPGLQPPAPKKPYPAPIFVSLSGIGFGLPPPPVPLLPFYLFPNRPPFELPIRRAFAHFEGS